MKIGWIKITDMTEINQYLYVGKCESSKRKILKHVETHFQSTKIT